jgi:hypothetical protein
MDDDDFLSFRLICVSLLLVSGLCEPEPKIRPVPQKSLKPRFVLSNLPCTPKPIYTLVTHILGLIPHFIRLIHIAQNNKKSYKEPEK